MKKILFDTSIILASLDKNHIHFEKSFAWIQAIHRGKVKAYLSTHCIAEIFSNIHKIPITPMLSVQLSTKVIRQQIIPHFELIELSTKDYFLALARMAQKSLRGGIIYDALHVQAALKKNLKFLITHNIKDFSRLVDKDDLTIINPLTNNLPTSRR